jgi:translation initiation factor 1 (eIF-1/SUI1)
MMKKTVVSKIQEPSKSGVVHINGAVHQKLKIYCAVNKVDMGKYATKELMESLKKQGVKF